MTHKTRRFLWFLSTNTCAFGAAASASSGRYGLVAANLALLLVMSTALWLVVDDKEDEKGDNS